ncbi:MAG TPA: HAD family hydrolase, partial [Prolixibacteraceae bacterium]|nr:HAD family hydrolase [Prolixibacteraceae bacterium]
MVRKEEIRLVATDLDGTLLRDDKTISVADYNSLVGLGKFGIVRVAATGRSLHKVYEVLSVDTPFDFIVFSTGAGIFDWKKQQLLFAEQFDGQRSFQLCSFLYQLGINFLIFKPIPHNNLFFYHRGKSFCPEFENYLVRHVGDFEQLNVLDYSDIAGQFLIFIPNNNFIFSDIRERLIQEFDNIKIIRTTSPVDNRFIWLEIFPESVSKGHGISWLCDFLGIDRKHTVAVGNDFNDIDML